VIDDAYCRADRVVAGVLDHVDEQTLLIVLSDHGFNGFRRGVSLNHWLWERGLLRLEAGIEPGPEAGDLLRHVDWSGTRAYALGLSGIYLNLEGREREGVVKASEADPLRRQIAGQLGELVDPQAGVSAVRGAWPREDVYQGSHVGEAPDVLVSYSAGYRVGWSSSLGGVERCLFEANDHPWSGDHIIDPALVPGMLVMNRPFRAKGASLVDLAPTILGAMGCPIPEEFEGKELLG
jgi:predicted AlkP superfamily phosphohydrolase/phosphomutase